MKTKSWTTIGLALFTVLFQPVAHGQGGDVYNFYFQKAPGPQTVIQGGTKPENSIQVREAPTNVEVAPPKNEVPTLKEPTPLPEKEPDFKKWQVRFGSESRSAFITFDDWYSTKMVMSGTGLGASYSFNKFLALDGTILFANSVRTDNWHRDLARDRNQVSGIFPYLGIEFTPVRLTLFNFDLLDISFTAGLTPKGLSSQFSELAHYRGFKVALNLSSNFGLQMAYRSTSFSEYGEAGANLVWRF